MTFFGKFNFQKERTDRESVILHENSENVDQLILGLFKTNDWKQNEYIMVYTEFRIFTNRLELLYSAMPQYIRNGQCPKRQLEMLYSVVLPIQWMRFWRCRGIH